MSEDLTNALDYEIMCSVKSLMHFHYFLVVRDITERGRDLEQVLTQYMTFVKPAFEEFCSPVSTNCY